ncbi:MAG: hypothetical protein AVDCRST_MAG61-2807, partial [uncultured Friedmanniella sp.]
EPARVPVRGAAGGPADRAGRVRQRRRHPLLPGAGVPARRRRGRRRPAAGPGRGGRPGRRPAVGRGGGGRLPAPGGHRQGEHGAGAHLRPVDRSAEHGGAAIAGARRRHRQPGADPGRPARQAGRPAGVGTL